MGLISVKHRYVRQDERGLGGGPRMEAEEVYLNPAQVVVILQTGDWFSVGFAGHHKAVVVDKEDLAKILAAENGA